MKNSKYLFVLMIILSLSTINAQKYKDKTKEGKPNKTTFTIKGMTCQGCVHNVENTIISIDGVYKSDASLERGEIVVEYDPNKVNAIKIIKKFEKSHYKVDEKQNKNQSNGSI